MTFLARPNRDLKVVYAAALLRSLGIGLTGVVLGVYLARAGFSATWIGVVIAAGLAGGAVATAGVSFYADCLGRRLSLIGLSVLGIAGGAGFALSGSILSIFVAAFVGMVNGMGTDRGPIFALEQAMIPETIADDCRTLALSWHSLILDAGHAAGALAAALPMFLARWFELDLLLAYRFTFAIYALLNLLSGICYLFLSRRTERARSSMPEGSELATISHESKVAVFKLAGLSSIDSLGGGLLTDALIAYWFFRRFGISESGLGMIFFFGHLLNSGSYLVAAWLSRRIGLLNTMVFTHIPSSLFLMAVPLAPSAAWAVALFFGREALVEMDVPTRQSYILAVVQPSERTFASGVTNLTRNISRSATPSVAGYMIEHLALATPLYLGGGIKILFDFLLYFAFRQLKPPEERSVAR